jgi:hypothetical protein
MTACVVGKGGDIPIWDEVVFSVCNGNNRLYAKEKGGEEWLPYLGGIQSQYQKVLV